MDIVERYLKTDSFGYFPYLHSHAGAFMFIERSGSIREGYPEANLFLISSHSWLQRQDGQWNDAQDQVVGPNNEFYGSLISPLLAELAVSWWDDLSEAPRFDDALAYCATFPSISFEIDTYSTHKSLMLETEGATWAFNGRRWRRDSDQIQNMHDADSPNHRVQKIPIHPSLAFEAMEWVSHNNSSDTPSLFTPEANTYSLKSKAFFQSDGKFLTDLIIQHEHGFWQRKSRTWQHYDLSALNSHEERHVTDIDENRLSEMVAWWDANSGERISHYSTPSNCDFENELNASFNSHPASKRSDVYIVDGARSWSRVNGVWNVEPWEEEEPDFEERLPDWFYNV